MIFFLRGANRTNFNKIPDILNFLKITVQQKWVGMKSQKMVDFKIGIKQCVCHGILLISQDANSVACSRNSKPADIFSWNSTVPFFLI